MSHSNAMRDIKRRKAVLENKQNNYSLKLKQHKLHIPKAMPNIIGDRLNIAILLFLYTLQGVPLGLSSAVPIIMQKKHITYKEQVR